MSNASAQAASPPWDEASITEIRRDMMRFARMRLRDSGAAEDMVQEALMAAMKSAKGFAGRSTFKTWIFAILRNKIIDHIRTSAREISGSDLVGRAGGDAELADFDVLFDQRGFWNSDDRPETWADPEASFEQDAFWTVFDTCMNNLPEHIARVYTMRELLELDTAEICAELGITNNNCFVILHRARLGLRECLENRWFQGEVR
ncbi:sigma-70 family RNA polymerase sigma factor [Denitromonas iodatirespirans]|uniref:Sigma-70 family RNA polymerase sigma factor n=1 Tax=Denitromonas iodatirespirans TaxID=2795389 RepID=A0A944H6L5_DENI1|nr:sigma-70 family RNA polymerase sigma factor [Denitromonas iodatirespirans]MBT0960293.1 sigma-70 family RNA polymerase sigma factor [Denitromonas iodatirespirans]